MLDNQSIDVVVTTKVKIFFLLGVNSSTFKRNASEELPIVPNYIRYPQFPYYDVQKQLQQLQNSASHQTQQSSDSLTEEMKDLKLLDGEDVNETVDFLSSLTSRHSPLMVKVRLTHTHTHTLMTNLSRCR